MKQKVIKYCSVFLFIGFLFSSSMYADSRDVYANDPSQESKEKSTKKLDIELIGNSKKNYTGEIYDGNGVKITDFSTKDDGVSEIDLSNQKENTTGVVVYLTSQDKLIPSKGLGTDFRSGVIHLNKDENILRIKIHTTTSTLKASFKVTLIDKLLKNTSEGFEVALYAEDGKKLEKTKADREGEIQFNQMVSGEYILKFLDIEKKNYISLTNNNQKFLGDSDFLSLTALNGPPWDRGTMYIISIPGAIIGGIILLLICFPIIYVALGYTMPRKEKK